MSHDEGLAPVNLSLNKKKRNLPGRPDPEAEVIALSPRSLLATNRFICEICNKGFQRDQNLQLHRRGHNLPWRLKQKESYESRKKVYICPETNCVHHDPARALGDLTGIKKHFSRKHGEKKWKCDKCSKRYAVQSDWKAHQKTCGTREYRCDCGTLFSRKDSFITHRAFCDVLAVENENAPGSKGETEKPEGSHDTSVHDDLAGRRDCSAPMEAASSPKSQVTGDPHASTVLSEGLSEPAIREGGIASLPSKWVQGGIRATSSSGGLGQGPGLSLCLGMGPGPGPPGALHADASETAMPPIGVSISRRLNKPGYPQLSGSESHNKHVPSVGAMGMLASLFSSSKSSDDAGDVSNYADSYGCSAPSSLGALNAGLSISIPSMMNDSIGPLRASLHHAAMSATAILQKAAQMGAKASTPSVSQKHGTGLTGACHSMTTQVTQKGVKQDYNPSAVPAYTKVKEAEGHSKVGALVFPEGIRHDSMNDSVSSMARVAQSGGVQHMSCMPNRFMKHDMRVDGERSTEFDWVSCSGDHTSRPKPSTRVGPQHREDRKLLDFLGVGGASGAGQILSQRDLASITSLNAGIKVEKHLPHHGGKIG